MYNKKELVEKITSNYWTFIKLFFTKNWKTIKSQTELSKDLFEKEFWNEVNKYNEKTEKFNKYMTVKENELNRIEDIKRSEKEKLDIILEKVNKNLKLLEDENVKLEEINLDLNEYKNVLLNFADRFNNNTSKIDELIEWILKYENHIKEDLDEKLIKIKQDLKIFFDEEKEKIVKFLEEKSKNVIDDKYNIENLKLNEEKREVFHFDLGIIIKYSLLLIWALWISVIDFLLVQQIVKEEFDLWRWAAQSYIILVNYVIPFIPSFILIFWEFLALKYLKTHKLLIKSVHFFSFILIFIILSTVFFTFDNYNFVLIESFSMYDLLVRIAIFVIAIPITVTILSKFFKTHEFIDYIRHFFLPISFVFLWLKYFFEHFILKDRKNKLLKESYEFKVDLSDLDSINKKEHKLDDIFIIPRTFHDDLNQVSVKTEKALSNIKDLQAFLKRDIWENNVKKIWFLWRLFWWNSYDNINNQNIISILDWKIERLRNSIQDIWKDMEEHWKIIDKKYEQDIENIYNGINLIKSNRKVYKKQYEDNKQIVEEAIDEALFSLK